MTKKLSSFTRAERVLTLILAFAIDVCFSISFSQDTDDAINVKPGRTTSLKLPGLDTPLLLSTPEAWVPEKKWPLMVYYNGTGRRPSLRLPADYGVTIDFVVVGMTNIIPTKDSESEETEKSEETEETEETEVQDTNAEVIEQLKGVLGQLEEHASIDPGRVYIGGFGEGGRVASHIADHHPELIAGVVILGAGIDADPAMVSTSRFRSKLPVFVGVGQHDSSLPLSLMAVPHFKGKGAVVTFDEWLGLGHELPIGPRSDFLQQWFAIESHRGRLAELKPIVAKWKEAVLARAKEQSDLMLAAMVLGRAKRAPFYRFLTREEKALWKRIEERLAKSPVVKKELGIQRRYFDVRRMESEGRYTLTTWRKVAPDYLKIYVENPKELFGASPQIS